jgi:hypothetical protein
MAAAAAAAAVVAVVVAAAPCYSLLRIPPLGQGFVQSLRWRAEPAVLFFANPSK